MKNLYKDNQISLEEKIEKLKEDFIKAIPQLREIQEIQETHREIQRRKTEGEYPFIHTQAHSTL